MIKPKITNIEDKNILDSYYENEFTNYHFNENIKEKITIKNTTFDSCIFENIDFTNIELIDVDLIDVIFDGCDLSNKCFDYKMLSRVEFKNCKMIGTSFIESVLRDILFDSCVMRYLNFSNTNSKSSIPSPFSFFERSYIRRVN